MTALFIYLFKSLYCFSLIRGCRTTRPFLLNIAPHALLYGISTVNRCLRAHFWAICLDPLSLPKSSKSSGLSVSAKSLSSQHLFILTKKRPALLTQPRVREERKHWLCPTPLFLTKESREGRTGVLNLLWLQPILVAHKRHYNDSYKKILLKVIAIRMFDEAKNAALLSLRELSSSRKQEASYRGQKSYIQRFIQLF